MKNEQNSRKAELPVNIKTSNILFQFFNQRRIFDEAFQKSELNIYEFENLLDKLYKDTLSKLESCIIVLSITTKQ